MRGERGGGESKSVRLPEGFKWFRVDESCTKHLNFLSYIVGEGNPYASAGETYYERTFFIHNVTDVRRFATRWCCPARNVSKRCPICNYMDEVGRAARSDKERKEAQRPLYPRERQLYLVEDLDDRDAGFQLWDVSFNLFGELLDKRLGRINNDPSVSHWDDFAHPSRGMTLVVDFEHESRGEGGGSWRKATAIDFEKRQKQYDDEEIYAKMPCLDELLIIPSYKDLKAAFFCEQDDDEAEESEETHSHARDAYEDEAPRRSRHEEQAAGKRLEDEVEDAFDRGRKPAGKREETNQIEHDDVPFDDDSDEWD